ncbi:MAG: hypothetical protein R3195_17105 [Gemmatimonadota bacterium]|nr:hypothetical protein [Gemmatimonadota bacterium]
MTVWSLAWRCALARRRLFVWNVLVPLLLLSPVALSEAAAPHRTAVFGVFFVFFATFGSAIPTVRDASDGWLDTVFVSGVPGHRWFLESWAAGTILDLIQLVPASWVLIGVSTGASAGEILRLGVALLVAIGTANVVGPLVAAVVRSLAEAALVAAAVSLGLLHLSGFFRVPTGGWQAAVAAWSPYRPLREALADVQAGGAGVAGDWLPALALAAGLLAGAARSAARWARRFEWPPAG